jgi:heavy metal sensor kinase
MFNSIRTRFLFWSFSVFAVFVIAFGLYIYGKQKMLIIASVDQLLSNKAQVLAGLIEFYEDGRIEFELTEKRVGFERRATLYDIPNSGHYYQIFYENGVLLSRSPSLGDHSLPIHVESVSGSDRHFRDATGPSGEHIRILTEKITIETPYTGEKENVFIVQTAESVEEMYRFLDLLKKIILFSVLILLVLFGFGGILIARSFLKPLREFSKEVGEISEKNLTKRINERKVSRELKELAHSFNSTLDNLERAFNEQKRFISDASHELRTPTAVVKSHCEIYLRRERDVEEYKKALHVIHETAKKMEELIEKLLILSRLERKQTPMKKENLNLNEILVKTTSLLSSVAETRRIKINLNSGNSPLYVTGDRMHISEVLTNILDNAIKYSNSGTDIDVSVKAEKGEAVVKVTDRGIGISAEEIPNIFKRFYRGNSARAKNREGSGLGLSIAKEIVEAHGGTITVHSTPGKGSTFFISFPLSGINSVKLSASA